MLVLTRKPGESLRIGADVRISVVSSTGGHVRLAIEAPGEVDIYREEIYERIAEANQQAARDSETLGALVPDAEVTRPAGGTSR